MVQSTGITFESIARFALDKGLGIEFASGPGASVLDWDEFARMIMVAGVREQRERAEAHADEVSEIRLQRAAGVLDEGQDDYVDISNATDVQLDQVASALDSQKLGCNTEAKGNCFSRLCDYLDVVVGQDVRSVAQLSDYELAKLQASDNAMIAYDYYGVDDRRNHVFAVEVRTKSAVVRFRPIDKTFEDDSTHGVTSPQDFFNRGGWLYKVMFYADDSERVLQDTPGFGGDLPSSTYNAPNPHPPPPESIVNGGLAGGEANLSGGVVRPKRRNIKGRSDFMTTTESLRTYSVSTATMFNNMEEMYLNTISKEYAQEIIEELFNTWNLPMSDPTVMKYAEDVLWAFLIARTASNKADYKFLIDVPTKSGDIEIDFDVFSRLLANKYGISRRNFSRGVADNLRDYLRREENQHLRSTSAQRIGADPQMGDMCFDGSTGCTGLTSSEASFARLLEARNLYERDDVIAEGASDKLMQGMSGGVRSVVPR